MRKGCSQSGSRVRGRNPGQRDKKSPQEMAALTQSFPRDGPSPACEVQHPNLWLAHCPSGQLRGSPLHCTQCSEHSHSPNMVPFFKQLSSSSGQTGVPRFTSTLTRPIPGMASSPAGYGLLPVRLPAPLQTLITGLVITCPLTKQL